MRVIAGTAKGRKLEAVPGDSTRPILDRIKTALFDTIRDRIAGYSMLDVFAGSGSVGIEALSQGAKHCIFLDINQNAYDTIKKNVKHTGFEEVSEVRKTDAFTYIRQTSKTFDFIFVAPPQYKSIWIEAMHTIAERPEILNQDGLIVVQIDPSEYEKLSLNEFKETKQKKFGNTILVFFEKESA